MTAHSVCVLRLVPVSESKLPDMSLSCEGAGVGVGVGVGSALGDTEGEGSSDGETSGAAVGDADGSAASSEGLGAVSHAVIPAAMSSTSISATKICPFCLFTYLASVTFNILSTIIAYL